MRLNKLSHKSMNSWLLLAALFAPIIYLFGALFTTQLGAHGHSLLNDTLPVPSADGISYSDTFLSKSLDSIGSFDSGFVFVDSLKGNSIFVSDSGVGSLKSANVTSLSYTNTQSNYSTSISLPSIDLRSAGSSIDSYSFDGTYTRSVLVSNSVENLTISRQSGGDYYFFLYSNYSVYGDNNILNLPSSNSLVGDINFVLSPRARFDLPYYDLMCCLQSDGQILIRDDSCLSVDSFKSKYSGCSFFLGLASPVVTSLLPFDNSLPVYDGGTLFFDSLTGVPQSVSLFSPSSVILEGDSDSDYLFGQFFVRDNFLAKSGRNVIEGTANYGFQPMGELIRFTDANMLHLANLEYGYLVIGYCYYAIHVVIVDLILYLTLFIPRLFRNIVERLEGKGNV